jgi:hypothetical protein
MPCARLLILGDSGSGKSTLTKQLFAVACQEQLHYRLAESNETGVQTSRNGSLQAHSVGAQVSCGSRNLQSFAVPLEREVWVALRSKELTWKKLPVGVRKDGSLVVDDEGENEVTKEKVIVNARTLSETAHVRILPEHQAGGRKFAFELSFQDLEGTANEFLMVTFGGTQQLDMTKRLLIAVEGDEQRERWIERLTPFCGVPVRVPLIELARLLEEFDYFDANPRSDVWLCGLKGVMGKTACLGSLFIAHESVGKN